MVKTHQARYGTYIKRENGKIRKQRGGENFSPENEYKRTITTRRLAGDRADEGSDERDAKRQRTVQFKEEESDGKREDNNEEEKSEDQITARRRDLSLTIQRNTQE